MADPAPRRNIVLDTAALIAGTDSLYALGGLVDAETAEPLTVPASGTEARFYTVPDVVREVRDARARARLALLQGVLVVRAPSAEALASVTAFARATGDYAALSLPDLRVLALCWMLERERDGGLSLRDRPVFHNPSQIRVGGVVSMSFADADALDLRREQAERARVAENDGWETVPAKRKHVPRGKGKKGAMPAADASAAPAAAAPAVGAAAEAVETTCAAGTHARDAAESATSAGAKQGGANAKAKRGKPKPGKGKRAKDEGAKDADQKRSDANDATAKGFDVKDADAKSADAKSANAKDVGAKDTGAKDVDAKDGDAKDGDAKGPGAKVKHGTGKRKKGKTAKDQDAQAAEKTVSDAKVSDTKGPDMMDTAAKEADVKPTDTNDTDMKDVNAKLADVQGANPVADAKGKGAKGKRGAGKNKKGKNAKDEGARDAKTDSAAHGSDAKVADAKDAEMQCTKAKGTHVKGSASAQDQCAKGAAVKGPDANDSLKKVPDARSADPGTDTKDTGVKAKRSIAKRRKGKSAKDETAKDTEETVSVAKLSAPKDIGVKNVEAGDVDAKGIDAKVVHAKDTDAKDADAKDADTKDANAKDVDAKAVDAKTFDAKATVAKDANAKDTDAKGFVTTVGNPEGVEAKDVESKDADAKGTGVKGKRRRNRSVKAKKAKDESVVDTTAQDLVAKDASTHDANSKGVDAKDAVAKGSEAKSSETKNIDAKDVNTKGADGMDADTKGSGDAPVKDNDPEVRGEKDLKKTRKPRRKKVPKQDVATEAKDTENAAHVGNTAAEKRTDNARTEETSNAVVTVKAGGAKLLQSGSEEQDPADEVENVTAQAGKLSIADAGTVAGDDATELGGAGGENIGWNVAYPHDNPEAVELVTVPLDGNADEDEEEDDGVGWINEDNLEEHLAAHAGVAGESPEDEARTGCVTTDFALQNTMLQMGIKVMTVDGRRALKKINHYALRCHACGTVTRELERRFCGRCGNAAFHRVAFKVDGKGLARAFINPKKQPVLRGTKFPIPLPRGGRHNNDLVLREDQIDPVKQRRLQKQMERKNVDVLDPTTFYNAGARFNPHSRPAVVGYSGRNPNGPKSSVRRKR